LPQLKQAWCFHARKATRYDVQKKYQKITLKSFSNSTQINPNSLDEFVSNSEVKQEYLTQTNDIIIRLRAPNIALYVDKNAQGLVISSLISKEFGLICVELEKDFIVIF
jgi:hypothetical protein